MPIVHMRSDEGDEIIEYVLDEDPCPRNVNSETMRTRVCFRPVSPTEDLG